MSVGVRRSVLVSTVVAVLLCGCGSGAGSGHAAGPVRLPTTTTTTAPAATRRQVTYLGPLRAPENYPGLALTAPPPVATGTIVAPAAAAHVACATPCTSTTPVTMTLAMVNDNNNMQHRLMYVTRATQTCSPTGPVAGAPVHYYTCGVLTFIDAHTGQAVEGADSPEFAP